MRSGRRGQNDGKRKARGRIKGPGDRQKGRQAHTNTQTHKQAHVRAKP